MSEDLVVFVMSTGLLLRILTIHTVLLCVCLFVCLCVVDVYVYARLCVTGSGLHGQLPRSLWPATHPPASACQSHDRHRADLRGRVPLRQLSPHH